MSINAEPSGGSGLDILPALLAILVGFPAAALLPGCGSGGGSGGGASKAPSSLIGEASDVTVADLGGGRFQVEFTLKSTTRKSLGIDAEYSEDLGQNFSEATVESPEAGGGGQAATYLSSPLGINYQIIWLAASNLSSMTQHDLVIKITPYQLSSGARGIAGQSPAFGIGANQPPSIDSISTPPSPSGGWVPFTFTVSDADSDFVAITGQYSLNGGRNWSNATISEEAGPTATSPAGVAHTVSWHAQGDAPEISQGNVVFRLQAADSAAGNVAATRMFSLNTHAPAIDLLTVSEIPAAMNGSTTYTNTSNLEKEFRLLLPETGFLIWIEYSASLSGAAVNTGGFTLTNSMPIGGGSSNGGFDAGEDFGSLLAPNGGSGSVALMVGAGMAFRKGNHSLTATASDILGNVSAPVSYVFDTVPPTAAMRPFDDTDQWQIDFTRDNFTITSSIDGSKQVAITATMRPNGISDFVEDLRILGLNSASPPPAAEAAGLNAFVQNWVEETILGHLNLYFGREFDGSATADSVNIEFFRGRPSGSQSRIAVGGDDPIPGFTIGRAEFDYRNAWINDNTDADLGVFSTNLIDFYINSSITFKNRFDALIPGRGTPVGFHAADITVLSAGFDRSAPGNTSQENARYDQVATAVDALGRVIATILAHEIGHSIGLVANGAPPAGLFGNEFNASFSGPYTTSFHLDTPGNNIMAAAISFSGSVATGTNAPFFNPMNFAYLLERILLD